MSEHDLFESVDLARERLVALRARLEKGDAASKSREIVNALSDLHVMFDKLQARFGLLREILDRTSGVVFAKDRDGRYAMINPQGAEMFGKTMTEILGSDDRAVFGRADAERIMAMDREVMSTGEPRTREQICNFRGVSTTLLTTTTAWYDADRRARGVIGIAQDVTERRRSEREAESHRDRMRSMAAETVIGEEVLRRSLAAELHDGLGQDLALAKMRLSTLRNSAGVELSDPLSGIEELVAQADRSLRSITYRISPPSLHDLGLVAALQWLGEDVGRKYGMDVRVVDDGCPEIGDERTRVILFRAVRALLIHAATHDRASSPVVELSHHDGLVRVTVEDVGAGFESAGLLPSGDGLFAVREQVTYIGGSVQVASSPDRGTTVTLTAPISAPVPRSTV